MQLSPVFRRLAKTALLAAVLVFAPPSLLRAQTSVQSAPAQGPAAPARTAGPGRELRVGVFLDADSLPLLVADAQGLFAKEGLNVRLITFQNPVERDAALQAGAVDGVVSDLLAAALAVQGGFDVRVTSLTDGRYGIVSAPGSGISSLSGLKGVPVGVSTNTIIQYATETMLAGAGLAGGDIQVVAVPKMPVRLELLIAGRIKAACLPEPLLSAARARGANLLVTSDDEGLGAGVLLFTKKTIEARGADLSAFYRAYAAACAAINADNDAFRPFLVQKANFPPDLVSTYRFVKYQRPRLPAAGDIRKCLDWLNAKGLLKAPVAPEALVDGRAIAGL